jgi:hypothetical protein
MGTSKEIGELYCVTHLNYIKQTPQKNCTKPRFFLARAKKMPYTTGERI